MRTTPRLKRRAASSYREVHSRSAFIVHAGLCGALDAQRAPSQNRIVTTSALDNMPLPAVSVVLSIYNCEQYIRQAVDSILNQTYRNFEFIVINDGSTDNTAKLLSAYDGTDWRLRVYHQHNCGLVEALNRGCGLARGEYLARMDADDIAMPDRLITQVEFMENHPDIGLLGGAVEIVDSAGRPLRISANPKTDGEIRAAFSYGCPFWHPTVMMRRNLFISAGGYRKVVVDAEDCDLWLRMADCCKLANLDSVVLKYRLHPQQVTIRKCKTLALSSLAAHAAATARQKGEPDPLDRISEITPELLTKLGTNETAQHRAVTARYLWSVRSMCDTGYYSAAHQALAEIRSSSEWRSADKRVVSDLCSLESQLHWRDRSVAKSLLSAVQAVVARPLILGRPLKRVIRSRIAKLQHSARISSTS
jgi:hypothetical protein